MGRPEKVPDDVASIGAQMRLVRQSRGVSLTEMAKRLYRNKGYLSSVETGRLKPPPHLVEGYEQQLGVPLSHLLGSAGPQPPVQVRSRPGARVPLLQLDSQVDSAATCFLWATALERVGQPDKAADFLRKALQLPGDATDLNNCAVTAEHCGDRRLACELYKRALEQDKERTEILINYGDCLSALANSMTGDEAEAAGLRRDAEEIFEPLLQKELDPADRIRLLDLYFDHLVRIEKLPEAAAILDGLEGFVTDSLEGATRYATNVLVYAEKLGLSEGRVVDMLDSCVRYLRSWENQNRDPTDRSDIARLLGGMASRLADLKQPGFADAYIAALELGLSDAPTLGALGVDLHNRGLPSVALDIWRVALTLDPADRRLWSIVLRSQVLKAPDTVLEVLSTEDPQERLRALDAGLGDLDAQAVRNRAVSVLRAGLRLPPEPQQSAGDTLKRTLDRIDKFRGPADLEASPASEPAGPLGARGGVGELERVPDGVRAAELAWLEQERDTIFTQYAGLWIGVVGRAVIAQGRSPAEVLSAAKSKGEAEPFVAFIPNEPIDQVHLCQTFITH